MISSAAEHGYVAGYWELRLRRTCSALRQCSDALRSRVLLPTIEESSR